MWNDATVNVMVEGEGSVDENGIYINGEESVIHTILADIQPYSKEQAYKDYGFHESVSYRLFIDGAKQVEVGDYLEFYDGKYQVIKMIQWDDYVEALVTAYE